MNLLTDLRKVGRCKINDVNARKMVCRTLPTFDREGDVAPSRRTLAHANDPLFFMSFYFPIKHSIIVKFEKK